MKNVEAYLLHATHYEAVLREADNLYLQGGADIQRGLGLFDLDRAHIQAGQAWATAHIAGNAAAQLCSAYSDAGVYVLDLRLHPREFVRWLEAALEAARQLKDRAAERD